MSEPAEGMLYHVELDDAGDVLTIEARQNGERISSVEIARSAWPSVAKAITEVEFDHDGESAFSLEQSKKRVFERIRAYQEGERAAEPNLTIVQNQLSYWRRLAERLAWHLADCRTVMKRSGWGAPVSGGESSDDVLAEFRSRIPSDRKVPLDYEGKIS